MKRLYLKMNNRLIIFFCFFFLSSFSVHSQELPKLHGISMHQGLKYSKEFQHFDYVNPKAQKGGKLRIHATGTFDSLNPFLLKGNPAPYLMSGRIYATLLRRSKDECFSLYPYVAESVQLPEDRSYIIFNLNPKARFEDQTPITVDDIIFTFYLLKEKASPHIKMLYNRATKAEKLSEHSVKISLDLQKADRETPLLLSMMPVLSKAFFERHSFEESAHLIPLSSGPYRVKQFSSGKEIVFERVKDFWGEELPVMHGHNNFDEIQVTLFKDSNIALEAFKAGGFDLIHETDFARWEMEYDAPPFKDGRIKKVVMPQTRPMGMFGIALNMRRKPFDDENVRKALTILFDHQWMIKNYYNNAYVPSTSFFNNCEFEAKGTAEGRVKEILDQYGTKIPSSAYEAYELPPLSSRERLKQALALFRASGWEIQGPDLVHKDTQKNFSFEVLIGLKPLEKIALGYSNMLSKAGIKLNVRYVDSAQFVQRKDDYDFDAVIHLWGIGNCPGKDLEFYFSSDAALKPGTRNYAGIKNPVIDDLIQKTVKQNAYQEYVFYLQALDRVLKAGNYLVPLVYWNKDHFSFWNKFTFPDCNDPKQGKLAYLTREDWVMDLWSIK